MDNEQLVSVGEVPWRLHIGSQIRVNKAPLYVKVRMLTRRAAVRWDDKNVRQWARCACNENDDPVVT